MAAHSDIVVPADLVLTIGMSEHIIRRTAVGAMRFCRANRFRNGRLNTVRAYVS